MMQLSPIKQNYYLWSSFFVFSVALLVSAGLSNFIQSSYHNYIFSILYEFGLIFMLVGFLLKFRALSPEGVLCFSTILYFYQTGFDHYIIGNPNLLSIDNYFIPFQDNLAIEVRTVHIFVLLLFILYFFITDSPERKQSSFSVSVVNNQKLYRIIGYVAILSCMAIIFINIQLAGGIYEYLAANKMERHQKLAPFIRYQNFFYIYFIVILTIGNKRDKQLLPIIVVCISIFVIISGDRRLIVNIFLILFLWFGLGNIKKKNLFFFLASGTVIFLLLTYIKYIYPAFAALILGKEPIWWYPGLGDKYINAIFFNGEFNAHMQIFHHALLNKQIILDAMPLMTSLGTLIFFLPLSRTVFGINYATVGEIIRQNYNEWSGYASSPFIIYYLELSFIGIVLIYIIYFCMFSYFSFLYRSRKHSLIIRTFALIFITDLGFAIHRNELTGIISNGYSLAVSIGIAWFLARLITQISHRRSGMRP